MPSQTYDNKILDFYARYFRQIVFGTLALILLLLVSYPIGYGPLTTVTGVALAILTAFTLLALVLASSRRFGRRGWRQS